MVIPLARTGSDTWDDNHCGMTSGITELRCNDRKWCYTFLPRWLMVKRSIAESTDSSVMTKATTTTTGKDRGQVTLGQPTTRDLSKCVLASCHSMLLLWVLAMFKWAAQHGEHGRQPIPQLLYLFVESAVLLSSFCALCSNRASGLLDLAVHTLLLPSNPVLPGSDAPLQLLNMLL